MIEGLRLDIAGTELHTRLDERIEHYRTRIGTLVGQLDRLAEPGLEDTQDQDEPPYPFRTESPMRSTQRRLERLQGRLTMLTFLREHLIDHETYRLNADDLTMLEILPERSPLW